jgi:hypothetical protein
LAKGQPLTHPGIISHFGALVKEKISLDMLPGAMVRSPQLGEINANTKNLRALARYLLVEKNPPLTLALAWFMLRQFLCHKFVPIEKKGARLLRHPLTLAVTPSYEM